jgi:hypothetical protein
MGFVLSTLTTLGINFIPLEMWLSDDFSGAETMVLYALENLVMLTLVMIVIRLLAPQVDLQGFAITGYGFCLVTLIFIAFFSFGLMPATAREGVALSDVMTAMKYVIVLQLIGFVIDLIFLRPMSSVGAERLMRNSLGRIIVVQFFGVFIGVFCAFLFGNFVLPFIVLKTLFDIGKIHEFFFGPQTDAEYVKHINMIKYGSPKNTEGHAKKH